MGGCVAEYSNKSIFFFSAADYFSEHLGEYRHVLSALEQLNTAVLSAMDKTKLVSVSFFPILFLWMALISFLYLLLNILGAM